MREEGLLCGKLKRFASIVQDCKNLTVRVTAWHEMALFENKMSLCVRKPTIWALTRSNTNRAVQSQKMVRGWKFWI